MSFKPQYKILDWMMSMVENEEENNKDDDDLFKLEGEMFLSRRHLVNNPYYIKNVSVNNFYRNLCFNPNPIAISIIENNIDKINWDSLSSNENAIELLEQNIDKVVVKSLFLNKNKKSIDLLKKMEHELDWDYDINYKYPYISSILKEKLKTKKKLFKKISWESISRYTADFCLFEKHISAVDWSILSLNPNAVHILEQKQHKIDWDNLSYNKNAIHLLEKNPDKINWKNLSTNPNATQLIKDNQEKVEEAVFANLEQEAIFTNLDADICSNPNTIHIIEKNLDKLNVNSWAMLNHNPNAIHILEKYGYEKMNWVNLSQNPNALHIFEKYHNDSSELKGQLYFYILQYDLVYGFLSLDQKSSEYHFHKSKEYLFSNPNIFVLDTNAMKEQCKEFAEELAAYVFHPTRLQRFSEMYNIEFEILNELY